MNIKNFFKKAFVKLSKNILLKNVNKTNFSKTVLLTYITRPFVTNKIHHTNAYEALNLSTVLKDLGYNVDVIFYESNRKLNYKKYFAVIGFGPAFIKTQGKIKNRIYYATGSCFIEANAGELDRFTKFISRRNVHNLVNPVNRIERISNEVEALQSFFNCNAIISVGGGVAQFNI